MCVSIQSMHFSTTQLPISYFKMIQFDWIRSVQGATPNCHVFIFDRCGGSIRQQICHILFWSLLADLLFLRICLQSPSYAPLAVVKCHGANNSPIVVWSAPTIWTFDLFQNSWDVPCRFDFKTDNKLFWILFGSTAKAATNQVQSVLNVFGTYECIETRDISKLGDGIEILSIALLCAQLMRQLADQSFFLNEACNCMSYYPLRNAANVINSLVSKQVSEEVIDKLDHINQLINEFKQVLLIQCSALPVD